MYITCFFTDSSVPKTGLTPTVSILRVSDDTLVVDAQAMTELSLAGWYSYLYAGHSADEEFVVSADGGATLADAERYKGGSLDILTSVMQSGTGAIQWTYTLTNSVGGAPIQDCELWITTDAEGAIIVASGYTDVNGQATFQLDAGTYYVWRRKSGWSFDNPDIETVSP